MNATTFNPRQLSAKSKTSAARKAAVKSRATKKAPVVRNRKPSTGERLHELSKYTWDFVAMGRAR